MQAMASTPPPGPREGVGDGDAVGIASQVLEDVLGLWDRFDDAVSRKEPGL
jgi:hypothetical protein